MKAAGRSARASAVLEQRRLDVVADQDVRRVGDVVRSTRMKPGSTFVQIR